MKPNKGITLLIFSIIYSSVAFCVEAPSFWIRNLNGERFDSRSAKDSIVISFFYVNCIPCIKEIPRLYKLLEKEFPTTKLLFINPIKEDKKKDIKKFAKKLKVPATFFYRDSFGSVSKKFFKGKYSFPTIVGIKEREILFRHSGIDNNIESSIRDSLSH